ncbi:uncharacterized protein [Rutidosis leptorrhynchoides]|uniref:uncharacterized protein n=1 Tax=Rutidosis leptorrhynchoides TaxID=125765 RepID=UPI003A9A1334
MPTKCNELHIVEFGPSTVTVTLVERSLLAREEAMNMLKYHLTRAHDRMKCYADKKRTERSFVVVVKQVGQVAYQLQLPHTSRIHPVFHVSQLKLHNGSPPVEMSKIPTVNQDDLLIVEPAKILDRRLTKKGDGATISLLVQWQNGSADDATWEVIEDFQQRFPDFNLDS